jgi:hypothetical protein
MSNPAFAMRITPNDDDFAAGARLFQGQIELVFTGDDSLLTVDMSLETAMRLQGNLTKAIESAMDARTARQVFQGGR